MQDKEFYKKLGARIKYIRTMNGCSQENMGEMLGVTFQQVQKYERGQNRLPVHHLVSISELFGKPIAYFLDNSPADESEGGKAAVNMMRLFVNLSKNKQAATVAMVRAFGDE